MRIPTVNDKIRVWIGEGRHRRQREVRVCGVSRGFGTTSPITVDFWIDWDEGPVKYNVRLEEVELVE